MQCGSTTHAFISSSSSRGTHSWVGRALARDAFQWEGAARCSGASDTVSIQRVLNEVAADVYYNMTIVARPHSHITCRIPNKRLASCSAKWTIELASRFRRA